MRLPTGQSFGCIIHQIVQLNKKSHKHANICTVSTIWKWMMQLYWIEEDSLTAIAYFPAADLLPFIFLCQLGWKILPEVCNKQWHSFFEFMRISASVFFLSQLSNWNTKSWLSRIRRRFNLLLHFFKNLELSDRIKSCFFQFQKALNLSFYLTCLAKNYYRVWPLPFRNIKDHILNRNVKRDTLYWELIDDEPNLKKSHHCRFMYVDSLIVNICRRPRSSLPIRYSPNLI